jgi:hypothetical protein
MQGRIAGSYESAAKFTIVAPTILPSKQIMGIAQIWDSLLAGITDHYTPQDSQLSSLTADAARTSATAHHAHPRRRRLQPLEN